MRILISYEESYHVHSGALERAIRGLHPGAEVAACLGGRRWHMLNPPLEDLLSFIDEVEALGGSGRELGGC